MALEEVCAANCAPARLGVGPEPHLGSQEVVRANPGQQDRTVGCHPSTNPLIPHHLALCLGHLVPSLLSEWLCTRAARPPHTHWQGEITHL